MIGANIKSISKQKNKINEYKIWQPLKNNKMKENYLKKNELKV